MAVAAIAYHKQLSRQHTGDGTGSENNMGPSLSKNSGGQMSRQGSNANASTVHSHKMLTTPKGASKPHLKGFNLVSPGTGHTTPLPQADLKLKFLQGRLELEDKMRRLMIKMPAFIVNIVLFIVLLFMLVPSGSIARVHRHLYAHFPISKERLDEVTSLHYIYDFIEEFEHANEELQATAPQFWCEEHFIENIWRDDYGMPQHLCPSPRLQRLDIATNAPMTFEEWDSTGRYTRRRRSELAARAAGGDDSHGEEEDSGHRRLNEESEGVQSAQSRSLASEESTTDEIYDDSYKAACQDAPSVLQSLDANFTCWESRLETCIAYGDIGAQYCPATCASCQPYAYKRVKKFDKPQLTMLPIMVHQDRFPLAECHGFAEVYLHQPHNEDLTLLPALDGERNGTVLECYDRSGVYDGDYAHEVPCPEGTPDGLCQDGVLQYTHKYEYHGEPIYPVMMSNPSAELTFMKNLGWLDLLTKTVTVSTLVYTEGLETFTSLSVVFEIDKAGNVIAAKNTISIHDLDGTNEVIFILACILCSSFSLLGVALAARQLWNEHNCKWGLQMYEMLSRLLLGIFTMILLISWTQTVAMRTHFENILEAFTGTSVGDTDVIQKYFDVKTKIYEDTNELYRWRCIAYVICYLQFIQLILYFNAHPKVAMLTATLHRSYPQLEPFVFVFSCVVLFLGFMAHWMLGADVVEFKTIVESLVSVVKMLYGEFLTPDGLDEIHAEMEIIFYIYALTFLIIVYYLLLNFFLAIVVENFLEIKYEMEEAVVEQSFFEDLYDTFWSMFEYRHHKWPSRTALIRWCEETSHGVVSASKSQQNTLADNMTKITEVAEDGIVDHVIANTLSAGFPEAFPNDKKLSIFLRFYAHKCKQILEVPQHHMLQTIQEEETEENRSKTQWRYALEVTGRHFSTPGTGKEDGVDAWNHEAYLLAKEILTRMRSDQNFAMPVSPAIPDKKKDPSQFTVMIPPPRRGLSLGLELDTLDSAAAHICGLSAGPITAYNSTVAAGGKIRKNDFIVSINGATGFSMLEVMSRAMQHELAMLMVVRKAQILYVKLEDVSGIEALGIVHKQMETGTSILISAILSGEIKRWNASNPDQAVKIGDRIFAVNGLAGSASELLKELSSAR
eukprot:CAMPEP_0178391464 /NCGR_PEP_ID=MMETSP0689_2-20121128/11178_1 /TAXON_ID=160604 /ORGANISM="Amphidinium massartii, Strain CS-259" /LENGTH=1125 /DNA_ID=CAMNT_0020012011 /DNA_START=11 /DNA_END=3385 /DNA_ORIENTATION=-